MPETYGTRPLRWYADQTPPDDEEEEEVMSDSDTKNLCDSCQYDFPTCKAEKIVFGIDRDPSARGAEADKVIECDEYRRRPDGAQG